MTASTLTYALGSLVLIGYTLCLIYILGYSIMQWDLLLLFLRKKHLLTAKQRSQNTNNTHTELPFVTVQLPIYNERHVVSRLIDAIAALDYPTDRFEIQVLDDSTDETTDILRERIRHHRQRGIDIQLIRRPTRTGYKAGALQYGLQRAKGSYIAIFDADFIPQHDFLRQVIPHFQDPSTAVVQTRWAHLNEDHSLLTKLQAFQLNNHFYVEQSGRYLGNLFLQFNGTAGVWRKKAILDAGGWQWDTLTEDLDLSYRAQLKGWKIHYLPWVGTPAELPVEMNSFKAQQYRWIKGGAETARKILPLLWHAPLPLRTKLHASFHLLSNFIFVIILLAGILSIPMMFVWELFPMLKPLYSIFIISLLVVIAVYFVANVLHAWRHKPLHSSLMRFLWMFPTFLSLSMGMSVHNTIAVLRGIQRQSSPFIRTPKLNISQTQPIKPSPYLRPSLPSSTYLEFLLAALFTAGALLNALRQDWSLLYFHGMLAMGFTAIALYSWQHYRIIKRFHTKNIQYA